MTREEELINHIKEYLDSGVWKYEACYLGKEDLEVIIKALEQQKTGHWIMHIDDLFPAESTMECSECGEHQSLTISDSYCPNCGAKMIESEG